MDFHKVIQLVLPVIKKSQIPNLELTKLIIFYRKNKFTSIPEDNKKVYPFSNISPRKLRPIMSQMFEKLKLDEC